ncbi:FKBP-type peptidyl-prolyl cis-trans isomerase 2 [Methanofollis sp. W23]|uniref:hypothetical protein n=1 Tax=Methanofollis sp. W23 TaxID=2817849 RepID=UPI001AE477FA|nr:hypothetical protein [Methanofollis sp. W23]MBP2145955.1 FKBP-type peptidyl-prolyl cis-trans isomerase 2 [Methanofollis sp. W23]
MVAKSAKRSPKEKKSKERNWTQIGMVVFGVLFAFLMVASYGVPAMSAFRSVGPGDSVLVEYTVLDNDGKPVITTSQKVMEKTMKQGDIALLTGPLSLTGGANATSYVEGVPVALGGGQGKFALLQPEIEAMNDGVIGMHERETKRVSIRDLPIVQTFDTERTEKMGLNFTELQVGDRISIQMTITDQPTVFTDPANDISYLRFGTISEKNNESMTVNFDYAEAEMTVLQITKV